MTSPEVADRPLRVCQVTSMHEVYDDRVFLRACIGLARLGHHVDFIVPHPRDEIREGVHLVGLKPRRGWRRRLGSSAQAFVRARKLPADVFHFHDPDLIPWMVILAAMGRCVVYDVHENYEERVGRLGLPKPLARLAQKLYRFAENLASACLAGVTATTPSMLELFGRNPRAAMVIPNVMDLELLSSVNLNVPKAPEPVIQTSGTNSPDRNCLQTVEALPMILERLPEARLEFIGRYHPPGFRERLKERAEQLGVADRLTLGDMLPYREHFEHMATAHLGCVFYADNPNNRVTTPNRLYEHMFCGVPVLAEDFPEVRRVVQAAGCGVVVDSRDPRSIARGAVEVLSDPERAAAMGRRGRQAVLAEHNFGVVLEQLVDFYRRLVNSRRRGRRATK